MSKSSCPYALPAILIVLAPFSSDVMHVAPKGGVRALNPFPGGGELFPSFLSLNSTSSLLKS